ncbi:MAG: hypothetical protein RLZZ50_1397 [Verrucomicrobiota bacterium]
MHVIGHDAPGEKVVTLCVVVEQGGLDRGGKGGVAQGTATDAGVEPGFDLFAAFQILRGLREGGERVPEGLEFFLRERIREAEGDCLEQAILVAVREVATRAPAGGGGRRGGGHGAD